MRWTKLTLPTKIMLGLLFGAIFGIAANRWGFAGFVVTYIKPVGTAFVKLITMVVIPLVFASLLVGTASLNDIRKLGRIGARTAGYYITTTVIAISLGLVLANMIKPGAGLPKETKTRLLESGTEDMEAQIAKALQKPSLKDTLLEIIPSNPIRAFAEGRMLQVIFFALLTGVCLTLIPPPRSGPVVAFFEGLNDTMIQMIHVIMKTAPYAVFALIAAVTADFGSEILIVLLRYALVVLLGLALHVTVVYSVAIKVFTGTKIRAFFKGIRPAQIIAFSSSSSSATLPITMECAEESLGVPREISSFALPLGATVNMDGTALYQGVAAVFIAQVYGMDLNLAQQLTIVLTATLASIGTAATPGASMATLVIVLKSIGVPVEGIGLILGLDRILDMCRTAVNVTGDASCAMFVAARDGRLATAPTSE
ncbi:MAG: dicarboxylate/amino acid:cation symporter [Planctomycetota bacterium]|jgi:Na+/H+-dicarboxylate symporter